MGVKYGNIGPLWGFITFELLLGGGDMWWWRRSYSQANVREVPPVISPLCRYLGLIFGSDIWVWYLGLKFGSNIWV